MKKIILIGATLLVTTGAIVVAKSNLNAKAVCTEQCCKDCCDKCPIDQICPVCKK